MTLEEKLIYFKEKGFTCDPETGIVISYTGKIMKGKSNGYNILCTVYNNKRITIYAHDFIWYISKKRIPNIIDHIDNTFKGRSDNRISNLRNVSRQKNTFNTKAKGYSWNEQCKKYVSQIRINNKNIYLGLFNTTEEAHQAYLDAKKIYHII
jgi:hypothetical protein